MIPIIFIVKKRVNDKFWECHNHKPHSFPKTKKEETNKTKQAQIEQTYEEHQD